MRKVLSPPTPPRKPPEGCLTQQGHTRISWRFWDHLVGRVKTSRRLPHAGGRQGNLAPHSSPPEQLPPRLHQRQAHLPAWHLPKPRGRGPRQSWKQTLCRCRNGPFVLGPGRCGLVDEATLCALRPAPALSVPLGISAEILAGGWYTLHEPWAWPQ